MRTMREGTMLRHDEDETEVGFIRFSVYKRASPSSGCLGLLFGPRTGKMNDICICYSDSENIYLHTTGRWSRDRKKWLTDKHYSDSKYIYLIATRRFIITPMAKRFMFSASGKKVDEQTFL